MTVYDETHANAFKTGEFGGGTGGGGNDGGGGGDDKKKGKKKPRSTPSRDTSHAARTETATPQGPPRPKRKATEARAKEDASGPRGLQRPRQEPPTKGKQEKVGTTASAIIPGVAPTGSASCGEWDSALQAAIWGRGSNFLRLQQLIGQLQSTLPAGQPAHGLSVLDFLKLQGLVAEWVDPAPNQLIPQANHKLLELCGSVLLPAAIRMSLEAARLVTALINALLFGVSDVVGTIETSMRGPRDRDRDDDDHRGRRETGRATGERDRPTRTEHRGHREDRRSDGSCQRNTEHKGRRHAGKEAKKAVGSSAGLTLPTPPTTGTWPRVRLFLQITKVGWTLTLYVSSGDFKTVLRHASLKADTTPFLDASPTPTAEPCALLFTGAPTVVRPNSNQPRSAPPKAAPKTMTAAARQDALRRLLGKPDEPPRAQL
jgi:hypothetical protein